MDYVQRFQEQDTRLDERGYRITPLHMHVGWRNEARTIDRYVLLQCWWLHVLLTVSMNLRAFIEEIHIGNNVGFPGELLYISRLFRTVL